MWPGSMTEHGGQGGQQGSTQDGLVRKVKGGMYGQQSSSPPETATCQQHSGFSLHVRTASGAAPGPMIDRESFRPNIQRQFKNAGHTPEAQRCCTEDMVD